MVGRAKAQSYVSGQTDIVASFQSMRVAFSDYSSSPVCGFSMMEQVRLCTASGELALHFQNHIQGWMNDLNMLLLCSGTTMSLVRCLLRILHF